MMTEAISLAYAKDIYTPIPRVSYTIPFGYVEDENDPDVLLPVQLELEALEKAKGYLKSYSYRLVANWLYEVTGRKISHTGLKKRMEIERSRKRKAQALKIWAKRNQETLDKIHKYEQLVLGAKEG